MNEVIPLKDCSLVLSHFQKKNEMFYTIACFQDRLIGYERNKIKNNEHEKALRKCSNLSELLETSRKFGITPIPKIHNIIIKETHVS